MPRIRRVNAHHQHPEAAPKGSRSSAGADPEVGKRPVVPDNLKATAASTGHDAHFYKHRVGQFMGDLFSVKNNAIISFNQSLSRSAVPVQNSFLGQAFQFVIGAFGGDFIDALKLGTVAAKIIKAALPKFAEAVGSSVSSSPGGPTSVDTSTFLTLYAHAIKTHHDIVTHDMKVAIHDPAEGKTITDALGGTVDDGGLHLTQTQAANVTAQTHLETLDAWTVAMQKRGDADVNAKGKNPKDHKGQSYGGAGLGQFHLDSLKMWPTRLESDVGLVARMHGVGNDAAQLEGKRKLEDIPVQRTANVRWDRGGGWTGAFGMSVSASGHVASDGLDVFDRQAVASFYSGKNLLNPLPEDQKKDDALTKQDFPKGIQKIWDTIKGKTPEELGFEMKGD